MADAPLAVGDVLEVRFEGTVLGNRWNNVRHFAITTAPSGSLATYDVLREAAEVLHDAYFDALSPHLSTDWFHNLTRVKRIRPTDSVFAFHADPAAGAVSGGVDEPDDALVVRFYTSQSGRHRQGRMYIAGLSDADVSAGYYSSTKALLIRASLNDLFSTTVTMPGGMEVFGYVWSPTLSNDGDPLTLAAYPITLVVVDTVVRRMTRRDHNDPLLIGS